MSRLLNIIGLLSKRAQQKRLYSGKETYNFKEPTNCSHPILPLAHILKRTWETNETSHTTCQLIMLTVNSSCWHVSLYENDMFLLRNIVSFISHFCKRDLPLEGAYFVSYKVTIQPIAFGMPFNLDLQSLSQLSLFNGTWQMRLREPNHRLRFQNWKNDTLNAMMSELLRVRW